MDDLAISAIVRDEGGYLPEWIAYHRLVGATKFLIYDNESKIPIEKFLTPVGMGDISVVRYPGHGRQMQAYTDALARMAWKVTWLAFIDVDEFLVPVKTLRLTEILRRYEPHGALGVNWQVFGSSGHAERPKGLQIESFKFRTPVQWDWNKHIKTIVRPERALRAVSPHHFVYKPGWACVNEKKSKIEGPFSSPVSVDEIRVNHYYTRSRKEYAQKMERGAGDGTKKPASFFDIVDLVSKERDDVIAKFCADVRNRLKVVGL